jgi:hypothetical protein
MFLLFIKAGLRAKEISLLTRGMVTDASGRVEDTLHLPDNSAKGKTGGTIPLNKQLREAIYYLYNSCPQNPGHDQYIVFSERGEKMISCNISHWFKKVYKGGVCDKLPSSAN